MRGWFGCCAHLFDIGLQSRRCHKVKASEVELTFYNNNDLITKTEVKDVIAIAIASNNQPRLNLTPLSKKC
jgi:hypothetical protein